MIENIIDNVVKYYNKIMHAMSLICNTISHITVTQKKEKICDVRGIEYRILRSNTKCYINKLICELIEVLKLN